MEILLNLCRGPYVLPETFSIVSPVQSDREPYERLIYPESGGEKRWVVGVKRGWSGRGSNEVCVCVDIVRGGTLEEDQPGDGTCRKTSQVC